MRRTYKWAPVFLCAASIACSRSELDGAVTAGPIALPQTKTCHSPIALRCTDLITPTSDLPLDGAVALSYLAWRTDHFDAVSEWGSVQSLVVSGTPPTLQLGASNGLSFSGGEKGMETVRGTTTDGTHLFVLTASNVAFDGTLHVYDVNNAPLATFDLNDVAVNTARVASFDDLTLVQYGDEHSERSRVVIVDARGNLVRDEPLSDGQWPVENIWGMPGAYGCGFMYAEWPSPGPTTPLAPTFIAMRVDGALETQIEIPRGPTLSFDAWPYDEHAIAMTWTESTDAGPCVAHLRVVRDDSNVIFETTHATGCYPAAVLTSPVAPTRVIGAPFGALLQFPDWSFQLVDPAGHTLGTRVRVIVGDASKEYTLVESAGDPYVAVLTTRFDTPSPHATLITCRE